jgi:hypothetical protein
MLGVGALIGALFLGLLVVAVLVGYLIWNRSTRGSVKQVHYDAEKTKGAKEMDSHSRSSRQKMARENEQLRAQMRQMLAQGGGGAPIGAMQQKKRQQRQPEGRKAAPATAAAKPLERKTKVQIGMTQKKRISGDWTAQFEGDWTAPLPKNWTAMRADDGATFYHNSATDETSWVHPADRKEHEHDPSLPEGWEAHHNEDGSVFYFNQGENKCASTESRSRARASTATPRRRRTACRCARRSRRTPPLTFSPTHPSPPRSRCRVPRSELGAPRPERRRRPRSGRPDA